jgi:hypothetical protein
MYQYTIWFRIDVCVSQSAKKSKILAWAAAQCVVKVHVEHKYWHRWNLDLKDPAKRSAGCIS